MNGLVWITAKLNAAANVLSYFLIPLGLLPGWLFATLVAAASGVVMLIIFKYTSNQSAIAQARRSIKAHLLALKLFKQNIAVILGSQGRILLGVSRLLVHAIMPLSVMLLPTCLLLSQLSLWYQSAPLRVGEEVVLTLELNGASASPWPDVRLQTTDAVESTLGPVRVLSKREICWNIRALQNGQHHIVLLIDGQAVEKEIAIGDGLMPVSARRPGWNLREVFLHPREKPFGSDSIVRAIEIEYPDRPSWTSGTDTWFVYWSIVSLITMLCFRRLFRVNL